MHDHYLLRPTIFLQMLEQARFAANTPALRGLDKRERSLRWL
jgi:hypothetical protein